MRRQFEQGQGRAHEPACMAHATTALRRRRTCAYVRSRRKAGHGQAASRHLLTALRARQMLKFMCRRAETMGGERRARPVSTHQIVITQRLDQSCILGHTVNIEGRTRLRQARIDGSLRTRESKRRALNSQYMQAAKMRRPAASTRCFSSAPSTRQASACRAGAAHVGDTRGCRLAATPRRSVRYAGSAHAPRRCHC